MNQNPDTVDIATFLDSPEAINAWKTDPLGCLRGAGISLPNFDSQTTQELNEHLASSEPKALSASLNCVGCMALVLGTMTALEAALGLVIAALLVGSEGGDAPTVPAQLVAAEDVSATAIASVTGLPTTIVYDTIASVINSWLTWLAANPMAAAAMNTAGVLVGTIETCIANAICKKRGSCS